jgi:dsDNA-binding SOS-regulon protein
MNTLKSIEVITIKKGSHKVVYTWDNGQQSSVMFTNKKEADKYVSFVKNFNDIATTPILAETI